jgi:phosphatidylglycerophosphatase A
MDDPMTLHTPRWLNFVVSTLAEVVLLIVTVGIITAMWLPAYLTSRQTSDAGDRGHDEMVGLFPRGK